MLANPGDVMAIVPTVRFNWLPRQTLYAEAQTRTARQQALRQQQDYLSAASDILAAAATNSASGMSNLAAQAALTRIQAAAKAKAQAQAKSASSSLKNPSTPSNTLSPPKSVTLPDGSKINVDPAIYLDGGSKLNVSTGMITFPDGTIIDTKTRRPPKWTEEVGTFRKRNDFSGRREHDCLAEPVVERKVLSQSEIAI